jgi:hypothetical protein
MVICGYLEPRKGPETVFRKPLKYLIELHENVKF